MTEKPRAIFDTSAWLAGFRGEDQDIERLFDTHDILTPDVCLLEFANIYADAPTDVIMSRIKVISFLHDVIAVTPEIAVTVSHLDPGVPLGRRLALAHAAEMGLPCYIFSEEKLQMITPEAASRMTQI